MHRIFNYTALSSIILGLTFSSCSDQNEGFQSIFNGKDLSGWEGEQSLWSVRDGAITGQTHPDKPIEANTFLIWSEGSPANFELRLEFRLTPQNDKEFGNSGIQYRARRLDVPGFVLAGYQADIDLSGKYLGMLYEEQGRRMLMKPGEKIRISPKSPDSKKPATIEVLSVDSTKEQILTAYNLGGWNDFVIIADGNHTRHYINGVLTADVLDEDPANAPSSGLIGLQLHAGEPLTIQFKEIQLKTLP